MNLSNLTTIRGDNETEDSVNVLKILSGLFLSWITVLLMTVTIVGNTLIILVWILKRIPSTQTTYYISLAIANLFVGTFDLPLTAIAAYNEEWNYGLNLCKTYLVISFALTPIHAYHLVAIGVDMYRRIVEGVSYIQRRTINNDIEIVLFIWVLGLWGGLTIVLDWEHTAVDPEGTSKQCYTLKTPFWVIHTASSCLIFPFFLGYTIHSKINEEIQKKRKHEEGSHIASTVVWNELCTIKSDSSDMTEIELNSERKENGLSIEAETEKTHPCQSTKEESCLKTFWMMILGFFVCWLPFCVFSIYDSVATGSWKAPLYVSSLMLLPGYASACINTIIYALRNPEFQRVFWRILKREQ